MNGGWDGYVAFAERTRGDGWYPTSAPSWVQYTFNDTKIVTKFLVYTSSGFDGKVPEGKLVYLNKSNQWADASSNRTYPFNQDITVELDKPAKSNTFRLSLKTGVRLYKLQYYGYDYNELKQKLLENL